MRFNFTYLESSAKKLLIIGTLLFFGCIYSSELHAQTEDPLNKPIVWKKIVTALNNHQGESTVNNLWEEYIGKSISHMSAVDKNNMYEWKQDILSQGDGNDSEIIEKSVGDDDWEVEVKSDHMSSNNRERMEEERYWKDLESNMLEEPDELKEYKQNITEYFVIIDMIYGEEFEKIGEEFVPYDDAHPDGDFDQSQWVLQLERKLRNAKLKYIASLREQDIEGN